MKITNKSYPRKAFEDWKDNENESEWKKSSHSSLPGFLQYLNLYPKSQREEDREMKMKKPKNPSQEEEELMPTPLKSGREINKSLSLGERWEKEGK